MEYIINKTKRRRELKMNNKANKNIIIRIYRKHTTLKYIYIYIETQ